MADQSSKSTNTPESDKPKEDKSRANESKADELVGRSSPIEWESYDEERRKRLDEAEKDASVDDRWFCCKCKKHDVVKTQTGPCEYGHKQCNERGGC